MNMTLLGEWRVITKSHACGFGNLKESQRTYRRFNGTRGRDVSGGRFQKTRILLLAVRRIQLCTAETQHRRNDDPGSFVAGKHDYTLEASVKADLLRPRRFPCHRAYDHIEDKKQTPPGHFGRPGGFVPLIAVVLQGATSCL